MIGFSQFLASSSRRAGPIHHQAGESSTSLAQLWRVGAGKHRVVTSTVSAVSFTFLGGAWRITILAHPGLGHFTLLSMFLAA